MKGIVKWFSNPRGYGFINVEGGDNDVFVHFKNISMEGYRTLKAGDTVTFDLEESDNGKPIAMNVVSVKED